MKKLVLKIIKHFFNMGGKNDNILGKKKIFFVSYTQKIPYIKKKKRELLYHNREEQKKQSHLFTPILTS